MKIAQQCIEWIHESPSNFHAIEKMREIYLANGFTELKENEAWRIEKGGAYFTTRNGSCIAGFKVGGNVDEAIYQIAASHSDSPTYKVKENGEIIVGNYLKLNTEVYGGMLHSTWLDRPLKLAGRVYVKNGNKIERRLYDSKRAVCLIPNVAIHMNRKANDGYSYNPQVDMLPMCGLDLEKGSLKNLVAKDLGLAVEDILSMELNVAMSQKGEIFGFNEEFMGSSRLDDLECGFTSLLALLDSSNEERINIAVCFDNEEVGSGTRQGAKSTFLKDCMERINQALGFDREMVLRGLASSFMISCDNAHAQHPNHPEYCDVSNPVRLNGGIVIKYNANQRYTTDALSASIFKSICEKANVPVQSFHNRSDMPGGSTLGNLSTMQISIASVDIGCAQLAMHSCYESAGVKDAEYMVEGLKAFYNSKIKADGFDVVVD